MRPETSYVFRYAFVNEAGVGNYSPETEEITTLTEEALKELSEQKFVEATDNTTLEGLNAIELDIVRVKPLSPITETTSPVPTPKSSETTPKLRQRKKIKSSYDESSFKDAAGVPSSTEESSLSTEAEKENTVNTSLEQIASSADDDFFKEEEAEPADSNIVSWLTIVADFMAYLVDSSLFPELPTSFIGSMYAIIMSNSISVVYLAFILAHLSYASLLSSVYAMSIFIYLIWCNPRPHPSAWRFLFIYNLTVISLKYIFQLSLFCLILNPSDLLNYWSVHPFCPDDIGIDASLVFAWNSRLVELLGLTKMDSYLGGAEWDFVVSLALFFHRYALQMRGLWVVYDSAINSSISIRKFDSQGNLNPSKKSCFGHFRNQFLKMKGFFKNIIPDNPTVELLYFQKSFENIKVIESTNRISITELRNAFNTLSLFPTDESLELMMEDIRHRRQGELDMCEFYWQCVILINEKKYHSPHYYSGASSPSSTVTESSSFTAALETAESKSPSSFSLLLDRSQMEREAVILEEDETAAAKDSNGTFEDNSNIFHTIIKVELFPVKDSSFEKVGVEPPIKEEDIATMKQNLFPNTSNPEILKSGGDFYVATFTMQMIIMLDVLFTYNSIVGQGSDIYSEIFNNNFAADTVLAIILCIFLIIFDRVAYLYRNMLLKVMLQYIVTIGIHYFLFVQVPLRTERNFQDSVSSEILYILLVIYLILGAMQIYHGYPFGPPVSTLTHSGYGPVQYYVFVIYRAIPMVWEMSTILDWICARTSLDLGMFMRVDDIAANLFAVKCNMLSRENFDEVFSGRNPMPYIWKFLGGHLCLLFLLLVTVGPLITFSTLNPALGTNLITSTGVDVLVRSGNSTFSFDIFHTDQVAKLATLTPQEFKTVQPKLRSANDNRLLLTDEMSDSVQQIIFLPYGNSIWDITPPAIQKLDMMLFDNSTEDYNTVYLDVKLSFQRPGPPSKMQTSITFKRLLTFDERLRIRSWDSAQRGFLTFGQLLPRVIRLPNILDPVVLDDNQEAYSNATLTLLSSAIQPPLTEPLKNWWTFESSCVLTGICGISMYVTSDKVVSGIAFLSTYNVITLYIGVVYTIARLMRSLFQSYPWQVSFEELPYPDDLISLCDGISLARTGNYEGNLRDEIKLWEILISLFRNPAVLMRITRPKIKYD